VASRKLRAEWALLSKNPGDMKDYHIVAASGSLEPRAYEPLVRRHLPGTPPTNADDPAHIGRLPWVWLGPSEDGPGHLGAAIMTFGTTLDASGRRTHPTCYLRIRWEDLSSAHPSYAGLGETLARFARSLTGNIPTSGEEPALLEVEAFDPGSVADTIEEVGFENAAATAALLLDRRVILGAGALSLPDRLAVLDAIVALLPYGCRAHLVISTWDQTSGRHRLSFARQEVDWKPRDASSLPPRPTTDPAKKYFTRLRELRDRYPLVELVEQLAKGVEPCELDPASTLPWLEKIDRPYAVWKAVTEGRGNPDDVRELLLPIGAVHRLNSSQVGDLVGYLMWHAQTSDLRLIQRYLTDARPRHLSEAVAAKIHDPGQDEVVRGLLAVAHDHDHVLDHVLADLVNAEKGAGDVKRRAVELCRDWVTWTGTPGPAQDQPGPSLRDALANDPAFVHELAASQVRHRSRREAMAMLDWLASGARLDEALAPLHRLLQDPASTDALAGFLDVLSLGPAARLAWWEIDQSLAPAGADDPQSGALRDLLALLVYDPPEQLFWDTIPSRDVEPYIERFHNVYGDHRLSAKREQLVGRLVRHLSRSAWHQQEMRRMKQTLELLHAIEPISEAVLALVAEGVGENSDILGLGGYQQHWHDALIHSVHAPEIALVTLNHRPPELLEWGMIVSLCAQALGVSASDHVSIPVAEVVQTLQSRGLLTTEQAVLTLHADLHLTLMEQGVKGNKAKEISDDFRDRILDNEETPYSHKNECAGSAARELPLWLHFASPQERQAFYRKISSK